jgi:undecaprenyl diphosphate synthase
MSDALQKIDKERLPNHIAIIMDGNGRWAKEHGQDRLFGHYQGVESVRNIVEGCAELGIGYLTLYAFSTENWDRPQYEVIGLMELLVTTIRNEVESLKKNGIRLHVIGNLSMLPEYAQKELAEALEITKDNKGLHLIMALSYSGRWELLNAVKNIAWEVKHNKLNIEDIDQATLQQYLSTSAFPDPELMIRTREGKDYALTEINRIVESNDAKITQLNTSVEFESGITQVTIRISKLEISDIISTFQRYEYNVKYYFGEELYENELKTNYDNLMNYLKI